jgi:hypothetical protein
MKGRIPQMSNAKLKFSVLRAALSVVLLLILAGCGDFKTEKFTAITSQGAAITKYTGSEKAVVIPETVNGEPIVAIAAGSFAGNETMETLEMPDTVELIEARAFEGCTALRSVRFSSGLEQIGYKAFNGCQSLVSVTLPERPEEFEGYDELVQLGIRSAGEYLNILPPTGNSRIDRQIIAGNKELSELHGTEDWFALLTGRESERERIEKEYEALDNPTLNDEFKKIIAMNSVSQGNYTMKSRPIEGYAPNDDETLPSIPGDVATKPDGKLFFLHKFNYDGLDWNFDTNRDTTITDNVNSDDYIMDFDLLTMFENGLDPQALKRYRLDDLAEVEYVILITHLPGESYTYYFEGSEIESIVHLTGAVVDLYKVDEPGGGFSKIKTLGAIKSERTDSYSSIYGNELKDFYVGITNEQIAKYVIACLGEISETSG